MMNDDMELVRDYAARNSEGAFETLVTRHVNLVYLVALRQVNNPHLAEEITQAVFIILARKAAKLDPKTILPGWLHRTTGFVTADALKTQFRRQRREHEAHMESLIHDPSSDAAWEQLSPLLDQAIARLSAKDRDALMLRYFQNKSMQEVGDALGVPERTVQKRVSRSLEKLRKIFLRRGVSSTTSIIAGAISANSVQAAPVTLAKSVTAVAIAKGATAGVSTLTLIKGAMKLMAWTKAKMAVAIGVAALIAGTGVVYEAKTSSLFQSGPTPAEIVKKSQDAYAALTSYSDEGKTVSSIGKTPVAPHIFTIKLARPDLYIVDWKQDSGFFVSEGTVWSSGTGDFLEMRHSSLKNPTAQKQKNKEAAFGTAAGISGSASSSIPGAFFKVNGGGQLGTFLSSAAKKDDEKIGGVDCYVLTHEKGGRATTLWIGKQDSLIHQIENITSEKVLRAILEAEAKKHPEVKAALVSLHGDTKSVETHSNIVLNAELAKADFEHEAVVASK